MLVALLVAACEREQGEQERVRRAAHAAVPGVETAVSAREPVRDVVRAFGAVAADGETPEVRDARAQFAEVQARRALAEQQVQRLEVLARGAVAPRKELEAARAEAASAGAAAARAGRVLAVFGADPTAGEALRHGETWVLAHVVQSDAGGLAAHAAVRFVADAFPERTFVGEVDAPPAYVDPTTQTAPVRIRLVAAADVLRPGMTGALAIEVGELRQAVVVPAVAVVYDGGQPVVMVAGDDGHFVAQPVRVGAIRDGRVEIVSGLAPEAHVATTGAASLLSALRLPAGSADEAPQ
jgi:hypothetical protein